MSLVENSFCIRLLRLTVKNRKGLYLIAQCWADGATLVTRETADPNCKRRVKIPDVCNAFGILCTDPFDAYRQLGMRL